MRAKKFLAAGLLFLPTVALAACGGKPAEADLREVMVESLIDSGATEAQANAYADCAAPRMHDELKADTLEKIIEDPMGTKMVAEGDVSKYEAIDNDCTEEALQAE